MPKLSGAQKAAIVLLALGEEVSASVLKNLTTEEIKQVGLEMSGIQGVKREVSHELLQEFARQFLEEDAIRTHGEHFLRKLLPDVLGGDRASDMFTSIQQEREKIPFKNVREIDARVLANFIKSEHPQTIAIILVHLGHEKASQVLEWLPESLQFEVVN